MSGAVTTILSLFSLSLCLALAQQPSAAPPPPLDDLYKEIVPRADYTQIFHLLPAVRKRTRNLLPHLAPVQPLMRQLLSLISDVDSIVTRFTSHTAGAPMITCNHREVGADWVSSARNFFNHRRLGDLDLACVTDAYDSSLINATRQTRHGTASRYEARQLFKLVNQYSRALDRLAPTLVAQAQPPQWQDASLSARSNSFMYQDRSQMCMHDFVGFAKVNGQWFVNTRVTNKDPLLTLGVRERLFMHELDGGDLHNFSVQQVTLVKSTDAPTVPPAENDTRKFAIWANDSWVLSQTAWEYTDGAAFASQYGKIFPTDNLAVNLALERGKHSTELAFDATTTSNIAILALPLAMSIVPVALIADVNSFGMLVYTLLTDVLSAVPLAIKGVEVLLIGKRTTYGAVVRISGGNLFGTEDVLRAKAAEIWVSECKPEVDFIVTGTTLLVVALVFMVGGVVGELVAKRWVQKKRQYEMDHLQSQQTISESMLSPQAVAMVMANDNARNKHD